MKNMMKIVFVAYRLSWVSPTSGKREEESGFIRTNAPTTAIEKLQAKHQKGRGLNRPPSVSWQVFDGIGAALAATRVL